MRGLSNAARLVLAANLATNVGNGMHTLTIGKMLYDHTGSAAAFGGIIVLEYVATFLLNIVAGPWVDRGSPKRTCVTVDLLRGCFVCVVSVILVLASEHMMLSILLVTLVIQAGKPFYRAASFTLEPTLVPAHQLTQFNGYANVCFQGGQLLGMALAAPVIQHWGAPAALALNGVSYLISALAVGLARLPVDVSIPRPMRAAGVRSRIAEIGNDWQLVAAMMRSDAGLAWLIVLGAGDYVMASLLNLAIVPIVAERLGGNPYWLSVLDGGFALGAMLAATAVASLTTFIGVRRSLLLGLGGQALFFLALAYAPGGYLTALLTFGIGTMNAISWTVLVSTLQLRIRGPFKGRIALVRSLSTAVLAAGLVPIVSHVEAFSLTLALVVSGMVGLGFYILALVLDPGRLLGTDLSDEAASGQYATEK